MVISKITRHNIPSTKPAFRLSWPALGLVLATVLLSFLIAISTYQNINRAQNQTKDFLNKKGETIIRSLEAGSRILQQLQHHLVSENHFHILVAESIKNKEISFIQIVDRKGEIIEQTDSSRQSELSKQQITIIGNQQKTLTAFDTQREIFIIARKFEPHKRFADISKSMKNDSFDPVINNYTQQIVIVGLATKEYQIARKQDIQHAIFMAGLLFLVGSSGLYFFFMYQKIRVTQSNLADMRRYTDNVIESIPDGLITLNAQGQLISCNRQAEEIIGQTIEKIQGRTMMELLPDCPLENLDMKNVTLDYTTNCTCADGRQFPITIRSSSLINDEEKEIGTVLIIRDMSEIKEMEQRLERSRRMAALGNMATGIAHEIRNPLGTLRGFSEYFRNQKETTDEGKQYAELMISEVDRLNQNVSELLQFARPRQPQFQHVNLQTLFNKTVSLMGTDFVENHLTFEVDIAEAIVLEADQDLLLQVLMNVLKNSISATEKGGTIKLAAGVTGGDVRITVSDTGKGMTVKEVEKMFDPFFTTRKTGTGLGLAVTHQIIEQHNGGFEVQTDPGRGTELTIILPQNKKVFNG